MPGQYLLSQLEEKSDDVQGGMHSIETANKVSVVEIFTSSYYNFARDSSFIVHQAVTRSVYFCKKL